MDAVEDQLDGVLGSAAVAIDEVGTRRWVQLDGRHARTVLAAVVLLLHQQVQLGETVKRATVALLVVCQWFPQADEGQTAFVLDRVAHGMSVAPFGDGWQRYGLALRGLPQETRSIDAFF